MSKRKILMISHEASLTGAPKLLLSLAKILKEDMGFDVDFFIRRDGPLKGDFQAIGKVIMPQSRGIIFKAKRKIGLNVERDMNFLSKSSYDIIICNTIANAELMDLIRSLFKGTIISYIHELDVVVRHLLKESDKLKLLRNTDLFFVPCVAVKELLVGYLGIEKSKVDILPYFIPPQPLFDGACKKEAFTVGGCGTMELRKGADLFLNSAYYFTKRHPDVSVSFKWQSSSNQSLDFMFLSQDIEKMGLSEVVTIVPPTKFTGEFFAGLDVFLLTSREDPYPLVVLESADASVPSICFANSGGAAEFIEGNGKIVNYLDIEEMVSEIAFYQQNPRNRMEDGEKAKSKLTTLHQNRQLIADVIRKHIG